MSTRSAEAGGGSAAVVHRIPCGPSGRRVRRATRTGFTRLPRSKHVAALSRPLACSWAAIRVNQCLWSGTQFGTPVVGDTDRSCRRASEGYSVSFWAVARSLIRLLELLRLWVREQVGSRDTQPHHDFAFHNQHPVVVRHPAVPRLPERGIRWATVGGRSPIYSVAEAPRQPATNSSAVLLKRHGHRRGVPLSRLKLA